MKKLMCIAMIALGALMVSCGNNAQEEVAKAKDARAKAAYQDGLIAKWQMAQKLATFAYENHSAYALTEAAYILAEIPTTAETAKFTVGEAGAKNDDNAEKAEKKADKEMPAVITVEALLADAEKWSPNDSNVAQRIADVKTHQAECSEMLAQARGAVGGAYIVSGTVYANSYQVYTCEFKANEPAIIAVVGDGDSDLDLIVMDANKKVVASDESYDFDCEVAFVPEKEGVYYMKIVNNDDICNNFTLATN